MIEWLDAGGRRKPAIAQPGDFADAHLSPDGKRLATFGNQNGSWIVQVYDLQRETWTPVTDGRQAAPIPVWSADGQAIYLGSLTGIYWTRADGASQPQRLLPQGAPIKAYSVSADGKRLAYSEDIAKGQLWTVPLENTGGQRKAGTPEPFLKSMFDDELPAFSPDGKWLAYQSNSSGTLEIYVRAFPDTGSLWKISNNGGNTPIWSRATHELLYQSGGQMMAVRWSEKGGAFVPEKPHVWSAKVGGIAWDLSPDGNRLLVIVPVDRPNVSRPEHEAVLFQNFAEYLRQHVPLSK